ncbi:hypothetical protein CJ030_MR3G001111 [Morella rubra]|uniref:GRF-type domain-containing protein n=1 Tax=Morella rubra TaxID=262757 RepID=A0A6A1W513_9ROSI|nr:hypothetical protein CJ030_MR3G001111 [Morella rubra]
MASSISTTSSQGNDDYHISTALMCKCGLRAKSKRSATVANLGCHFYSCVLFGKQDHVPCDFFKWIDPPVDNMEMMRCWLILLVSLKGWMNNYA